jgi:hypothetical protein
MKSVISFLVFGLLSSYCFSQNVGVGVPNPQEKLDVGGGVKLGYTPSTNSQGTLRMSGDGQNVEYNNGFNWRQLVNYYKDSSISTSFITTTRNTLVQVPGVSMTISETGYYHIIFNAYGYNNNTYFPGSGNSDNNGFVEFHINGGLVRSYPFLIPQSVWSGTSNVMSYFSFPYETSVTRYLQAGDKFTIWAEVFSTGSTPGSWVISEAEIRAIRLN